MKAKRVTLLDRILARAWHYATRVVVLTITVTLFCFWLYWRTAAPTVLPGDPGEFQFAAWGFWLAHPTGYPSYLLLGGIWQHLVQIGDPAFRMNLFSAFWSAVAVGAAFLVFWIVTRARGASLIAALTLAITPLFWSQATRAEVYALNSFLVALLALWGILWHRTGQKRFVIAFALTFGFALTHHRSIVLLMPAFAALFAERVFSLQFNRALARRAMLYGACVVLPLFLYLYIPLRAGATPYATIELSPAPPIVVFENSPRGWLSVILGSGFSGELAFDARSINALRDFATQWLAQMNPIGVLLTVFGFMVLLWQKKYSVAAFALFGSLAFVLFNSVYHIGDIGDYYTTIYFFFCLPLAAAIAFVVQQLRVHPLTRLGMLAATAQLAAFALVPMQNLFNNFYLADLSRETETRTTWTRILESDLPFNAILISNDRDELTPLYYFQLVEKQRPQWIGLFSRIANDAEYENVVRLIERTTASGRPMYAIKPLPALTLRYMVETEENGMSRILPTTPTAPPFRSNTVLGDALRVRGYSILSGAARAGQQVTLAVQYVPLKKLSRNYTTSLQLFDTNNEKIAQGNDHVPGAEEYPSSEWRVNQVVQDQFEIELAPNLRPGNYRIMLRMYDPSSGDELGELTQVGQIDID